MPRILIAEDERSISNLIRLALAKEGYDCVCAGDGDEVVDILEGGRFDLVLLDVMLPKVDGFALMDFIRPLGVPVISSPPAATWPTGFTACAPAPRTISSSPSRWPSCWLAWTWCCADFARPTA